MLAVCLHCEQAPQETYLRLCHRCAGVDGLRQIYKKTASWTAKRDARIQAYVEKAKRQVPLFEDERIDENSRLLIACGRLNAS